MADGSVPITAGSGTPIRALSNSGVQSGAYQQVFSLAGQDGTLSPSDPDGTIQVSNEATTLFLDDFSGTLTSNHTTGGTAPSNATGSVTFSTSTTAGTLSYCRTTGTFILRAASYLISAFNVKLEAAAVTNHAKWWGLGLYGTPNSTTPVVNGAIFMTDGTTGNLFAAAFSASARTYYVQVNRPTDAILHRYEIRYRQSVIYWLIDGYTVATLNQPNLAVANNLASVMGSAVNSSGAAGATPSWFVSSEVVADLSGTNRTISDGANPWIQATVKTAATAATTSDFPLVVTAHPSSAAQLVSGSTNQMGWTSLGAAAPSASYYTSTTTNAATVAKTSAGFVQNLVISNSSTSQQFVKLYNATAVTLGTTAAVIDVPIAASSTLSLQVSVNGLRFTTGIAYAVTGAIGATNNTAGAGGVLIALTYV